MKRAYIFGGGIYNNEFPVITEEDFIIAADKGCEVLKNKGIVPHVSVGDFDSSSFIPSENAVVLPVEKDVTDTAAAVEIALKKSFSEIYIYGGMGGRPDHTFANYAIIAALSEKGVKAFLVGEGYEITAVTDGSLALSGVRGETVSVFSFSESSYGVSLKGLKYSLENATLKNTFPLGVSNSFNEDKAEISVEKGTLLVMRENKC